jgi:hypothetical protein
MAPIDAQAADYSAGHEDVPPPAPLSADMPEKRVRRVNKRLIDEVTSGEPAR